MIVYVDLPASEVCFPNTKDVNAAGDVIVVEGYARTRQPFWRTLKRFKDRDIVKGTMVNTNSEVLWGIWDVSAPMCKLDHHCLQ